MAGVVGTKRWRYVVSGEVPPGVDEGQMTAAVHSSIAIMSNLIPAVRDIKVEFTDDDPAKLLKLK